MNTVKIYFSSILIIFFLVLSSCSSGQDKDLESVNNFETEMGTDEEVIKLKSWEDADPDIKTNFLNDYKVNKTERRETFENYYDSIGPKGFLDFLEDKYAKCHNESHPVGKTIYKKEQDVIKSLRICANRCTNGCMHGVIAEAYGGKDFNQVVTEMKKFCTSGEMADMHKPGNCAHAMGHALMLLTSYELGKSIEGCNKFDTPAMSYYCSTGVFMEFSDKLILQEELGLCGTVNRTELHYPCNTYKDYPAACYRYTLNHIAKDLGGNTGSLVGECNKLSPRQRLGCYHALGVIYSPSIRKNPKLINSVCMSGNHDEKIICIEGVIEKLADYNEEEAMNVCYFTEGEYRKVCESAAREKMYRLDKPSIGLYTN